MFTIELRVNGTLVTHVYGRNVTDERNERGVGAQDVANGADVYDYELYETESRRVTNGTVTHKRNDGIRALAAKILRDVERIDKFNHPKK